jgi:hypothetical protein
VTRIAVRIAIVLAVLTLTLGLGSWRRAEAKSVLMASLREHRQAQIQRLHAYAQAGRFPRNYSAATVPIHMFKDREGRLCAVANLLHLDGLDTLVDRMAETHNDVVVADEATGPLHDWVLTSGLTNEEVRRIQGVGFLGLGEPDGDTALLLVEQSKMGEHLRAVEAELVAATDASLEVAVLRLSERPMARAGLGAWW